MNDIYFLKDTWGKIKSLLSINNLTYFIGAAFILFAMERLMYLVRISYDRTGLLLSALALCYTLIFIFVGRKIQRSDRFNIISPLLFTLALFMVPSFIQGIQHYFNLWASYSDKAVYFTLIAQYAAATLVGLVILYWTKIPFLVLPFLYFTWSLLTSISYLFTSIESHLLVLGGLTIALSLVVLSLFFFMRKQGKEHFAFWGYLSAMALFQHGLYDIVYSGYQGPEWLKIIPFFNELGGDPWAYLFFRILCAFLINLGLIVGALRLGNYILLTFGACGAAGYLISLLHRIFDIYDLHAGLPLILSLAGIGILFLTVLNTTNKIHKKNPSKVIFCAYILGTILLLAAAYTYHPFWFRTPTSALLLSITAIFYAGIFTWMGRRLLRSAQTKYSGLAFTLAIGMVPYFVYGILHYIGLGTNSEWSYYIEKADHHFNVLYLTPLTIAAITLLATLIMIFLTRSSFLMIPFLFSSWFLCTRSYLLIDKSGADIIFGLCMVLLAYFLDHRTKENYAFWGYLFGILTIQLGLTEFVEFGRLIFGSARSLCALDLTACLSINFLFIVLSIVFNNKVIGLVSMAGMLIFGFTLIENIFADIISTPLLLSITGVAIILCTIFYMKKQEKIDKFIQRLLPKSLLKYRPENRILR